MSHARTILTTLAFAAIAAGWPAASHALTPIKPRVITPNLVVNMADLKVGTYKNASPADKLALLARIPNRYKLFPLKLVTNKTGVGVNGLTYSIGKSQPTLTAAAPGATQTTTQSENLVVCKTTPVSVAKIFAGPLFIGTGTSINQSVIYPGALFKDSDIVRGQFTPQVPTRKPGSITIDVFNEGGGVVQPVSNFNDRSAVVTAINALRTETSGAQALTNIDYAEFTVSASQQLSLEAESSMDVDLGPSLNLPIQTPFNVPGVSAGVSATAAINTQNSQNFAIGVIDQVFYTISLGGEGPASTVEGTLAADVVAVTDVQYGRIAYIIVASTVSRTEAQAVAHELVEASNPLAAVSQESELSAAAQFALSSSFVRVKIMGGSVANAVTVTSLATLRNYVEQIKPTVGGTNAVPIRYTLRYAADNATAFVGALANFNDRECARASQVRVKLKTITPTKVVDFGGEELYGNVRIPDSEGVTPTSSAGKLWEESSSSPVQGNENQAITVNKEIFFNLNPLDGPSPSSLKLKFLLKDRIMNDPEYAGATDAGRSNGFVQYFPDEVTVSLSEIRDAANSTKTKTFSLKESGQEAKVDFKIEFELIPVR